VLYCCTKTTCCRPCRSTDRRPKAPLLEQEIKPHPRQQPVHQSQAGEPVNAQPGVLLINPAGYGSSKFQAETNPKGNSLVQWISDRRLTDQSVISVIIQKQEGSRGLHYICLHARRDRGDERVVSSDGGSHQEYALFPLPVNFVQCVIQVGCPEWECQQQANTQRNPTGSLTGDEAFENR